MKRRLTTLEQLTRREEEMLARADILRKQRGALATQRKRLEKKAQQERWVQAGKLLEVMGFPTHDLDHLERLLKDMTFGDKSCSQDSSMSITVLSPPTKSEPQP